ncbi:hypothetical protein HL653_01045 [Sphingomonas sp. AP4-R1]|uniref:hypothetical protein n=1 Tax=Sphingomonas sp. AP4-R1 TaxID=2735134 RepID=UPI001493718D|nr:hypothetical protein [Sphingomonas sp. AP4-R1]QJU56556.1 hypothetical protein HL653_01045 [Sphingomonas sp. AP4-R1]
MHKISIEQGLRALQHFLAAEWRLALPVALAFLALPPFGLGLVLAPLMKQMPSTIEGIRALSLSLPGWVTPVMALGGIVTIVGAMTLQALLLLPRISVGEAILAALRHLPAWIGACLIVFAAMFAFLITVGFLVGAGPGGASILVLATFFGMTLAGLYLVLIMPLIVERGMGPLVALRYGFSFYGAQLPRLISGLILFLAGAWILAMAIQVALGSVFLLLGRMIGQPDLGQILVGLLGAIVSSVEWGAFYLLVACFYAQRARG